MPKNRNGIKPDELTSDASGLTLDTKNGDTAIVEIPVAVPPDGYFSRRIDLQLTGPQTATLKRIVTGLDATGARLESGRRVTTGVDAIRWLLEKVAYESDASEVG